MRINKFISETGYCSRREADKLVDSGRVTINGAKAELGSQAELGDDVRIDGKRIGEQKHHVYIALNKPVGITSTTELHIRGNIVDFVGHKERIFPIGRLDKDSEGLILLTNDGDVVNPILRSEGKHEKEYIVTVDRPVTAEFVKGMSSGVRILGSMTLPCQVTRVGDRVFRIVLTEGKNRQIRRMCEAFGYHVRKLQRIRIMNIHLGQLPTGKWRDLTEAEKTELFGSLNYRPS
ncbi:23S rRNA pseudouridine(2604) synthase RluF [Paenibacillus sp. BK033]|uniref:23S rRNA pseudouridine(2604) synthase RluF n=1 Tax=unclassified Paenibacillus TaxID=185978 RepID=UPI001050FFD6|nr:23S rRNA pseudouridine(2604) synthase RluF [Paenibacillus sp. BK033]NIK72329.1 23S rRNA pseudouridine2604 synthase [Paenibacillus sp. BK720]TCM89577.1 23S rRNA pseudouridine2604 synthase [Paenibacillus sp. BK033]